MTLLNWLLSPTLRQSVQMRRHVKRLAAAQRDLMTPEGLRALREAMEGQRQIESGNGTNKAALEQGMAALEKVATKWLKAHPNAGIRENIEVLLVAIAVAMGIRTFFLQPFKIPTGSMQPTLYGITGESLMNQPDAVIPSRFRPGRLVDFWFNGVGYTHVVSESDGRFEIIDDLPKRFLLFNLRQRFRIGNKIHTVWFPPEDLWKRAGFMNDFGLPIPHTFKTGQDVIKLKTVSGDHLFVDRCTFNFRRPRRGDIIVFETKGIRGLPQDQYYIKRLVALGGETVRIGNDRHLYINNQRLDASTSHFELIYSFKGPPEPSVYSGHVNGEVVRRVGDHGGGSIPPLFPDETAEYRVREDHYMVMGDNTMNSLDSRYWGDFPCQNVLGKSFFIYWPIGAQPGHPGRFGWSHR